MILIEYDLCNFYGKFQDSVKMIFSDIETAKKELKGKISPYLDTINNLKVFFIKPNEFLTNSKGNWEQADEIMDIIYEENKI